MVCAAQNVFPEATCSGSYLRLAQALFRKWRELKLGALYGNEKGEAGNIARMTFRLDFQILLKMRLFISQSWTFFNVIFYYRENILTLIFILPPYLLENC